MRGGVTVWIVVLLMLAGVPASMGQGRGRGQDRGASGSAGSAAAPAGSGFGKDEARIIVGWFHDSKNLSGLPPGLANREQLPPGLQRQLARNGHLPPGLEKKIQPLPPALEVRLPPLPDDRRRIIIGGNIILMDRKTSIIVDILTGIF